VIEDVRADGCVIFTVKVAVQPLASVAVTLYAPSTKPVAIASVWPLFHKYVIAPVPPPELTVATPSDPPKQLTFTELTYVTVTALGCVMVVEEVVLQPFASYTVTV
jgi:hypothetical protein